MDANDANAANAAWEQMSAIRQQRWRQSVSTPSEDRVQGGCTLSAYERDVLRRVLEDKNRLAGDAIEPRGWVAMQADTDADVLRGLLERLG